MFILRFGPETFKGGGSNFRLFGGFGLTVGGSDGLCRVYI